MKYMEIYGNNMFNPRFQAETYGYITILGLKINEH